MILYIFGFHPRQTYPTVTNQQLLDKFNANKNIKLVASLAIDALGMASYVIPALGEFGDVLLAPITAVAIYMTHRSKVGAVGGFLEEIMPLTDIIPTATLIWIKRYQISKEATFKAFLAEHRHETEYTNKALQQENTQFIETIELDKDGNSIKYK